MDPEKIMEIIAPLRWEDKVIINKKILYRHDEIMEPVHNKNHKALAFEWGFHQDWDKSKMMLPPESYKLIFYCSYPDSEIFSKAVLENIETGEKEEVKSVYVDPELLEKRKNTKEK